MRNVGSSLFNPDPVTPGSNDRVGAPNHHQHSGSGETLMVGNNPRTRPGADGPLVAAVFARIGAESHRFLSVDDRGRFTVSLDRLAVLVAEIVTDHTDVERGGRGA